MLLFNQELETKVREDFTEKAPSRRFQLGEGPSRGLLRDCENRCETDGSNCGTNMVTWLRWPAHTQAAGVRTSNNNLRFGLPSY